METLPPEFTIRMDMGLILGGYCRMVWDTERLFRYKQWWSINDAPKDEIGKLRRTFAGASACKCGHPWDDHGVAKNRREIICPGTFILKLIMDPFDPTKPQCSYDSWSTMSPERFNQDVIIVPQKVALTKLNKRAVRLNNDLQWIIRVLNDEI